MIAGGVVLVYPGTNIVVLTSVLGIVLIVDGACLIATGFAIRRPQSGTVTAVGPGPRPAIPRPAVPPRRRGSDAPDGTSPSGHPVGAA